jgi:hypothetical protein
VAILVAGVIRWEGRIEEFLSGAERESDVVLARVPAALGASLEERYAKRVHGSGDRIEVRLPEKDTGDLLRAALDAGAEVVSVTPHRASLETIFLSAVRAGAS